MVRKSHKNKKSLLIIAAVLFLILIFVMIRSKIGPFGRENQNTADDAKTSSNIPTAQEDYSDGNERTPGNTLQEGEGSGSVEDTGGNTNTQYSPAQWSTSSSGELSVHNPAKKSKLVNGTEISGTSQQPTVNYRVIDNNSGVIAQGELKVVKGKYSGNLNFTTSAAEGRLDVFNTKADGSEFNNIEIPIIF